MSRMQMPKKKPMIPAREGHWHDACDHWCYGYGCERNSLGQSLGLCQKCKRDAFNRGAR